MRTGFCQLFLGTFCDNFVVIAQINFGLNNIYETPRTLKHTLQQGLNLEDQQRKKIFIQRMS